MISDITNFLKIVHFRVEIKIILASVILDFLDVTVRQLPALVLTTLVTMVEHVLMVLMATFAFVPLPLKEFNVMSRKIYATPILAKMVGTDTV